MSVVEVKELKRKVLDRDATLVKAKDRYRSNICMATDVERNKTRGCFFRAYPDLDWVKVEEAKVEEARIAGKDKEPHPKDDKWIAGSEP